MASEVPTNALLDIEFEEGNPEFLSLEKRTELEQMIEKLGDKNSYIPTDKLPTVLKALGMEGNADQLEPFIEEFTDHPGILNVDEIIEIIRQTSLENFRARSIRDACRLLDKRNNGCVSCKDLLILLDMVRKKEPVSKIITDRNLEIMMQEGEVDYLNGGNTLRRLVRNF
jgi:Ca2+-binding EF-hand superfamily protein